MTVPSIADFSTNNMGLKRILAQLLIAQASDPATQAAILADQVAASEQLAGAYQAEINRIVSSAHVSGGRADFYNQELVALQSAVSALTNRLFQPSTAISTAIAVLHAIPVR